MLVYFSNGSLFRCLFKWWSEYRSVNQMVIWILNYHGTGFWIPKTFKEQTNFHDLNTKLASYSDPHCTRHKNTGTIWIVDKILLSSGLLRIFPYLKAGLLVWNLDPRVKCSLHCYLNTRLKVWYSDFVSYWKTSSDQIGISSNIFACHNLIIYIGTLKSYDAMFPNG